MAAHASARADLKLTLAVDAGDATPTPTPRPVPAPAACDAAAGAAGVPAEPVGVEALIARAVTGDGDAWRGLVEAYTRRVFGLVLRSCGDRDLAEEVTQATFVKLVAQLTDGGGYQERGRFEAFIFRIAMNHLRDEMRRRKRQARTMDMTGGDDADGEASPWAGAQDGLGDRGAAATRTPHDPLEAVSTAEQVDRLRAAVATMSPADQEVLHLRHTAGLSFAQIAETLGQPLGTVLARGHRALGKLRAIMTKEEG